MSMKELSFEQLVVDVRGQVTSFFQKYQHGVVLLFGATATGKTALSLQLPQISVINADSRQFFRQCTIVTDKLDLTQTDIPHYLIDTCDLTDCYTAGQRKKNATDAIEMIHDDGRLPCVVWGTALYMDLLYKNYTMPDVAPQSELRWQRERQEAQQPWSLHDLLQKIDPVSARDIHPHNTRYIIRALEIHAVTWQTKSALAQEREVQRPLLFVWLTRDIDDSLERIAGRVDEMIVWWMFAETKHLIAQVRRDSQALSSIGYREALSYLAHHDLSVRDILDQQGFVVQDIQTVAQLKEAIVVTTRQLAKKQRTWMRRYVRESEENPKKNVEYAFYQVR